MDNVQHRHICFNLERLVKKFVLYSSTESSKCET